MEVVVRYFTVLRNITGKREEKVPADEGSTVEDVLDKLCSKYGREFKNYVLSGRQRAGLKILFFLDGRNIEDLGGLKTRLRPESVLSLIPPVAGG